MVALSSIRSKAARWELKLRAVAILFATEMIYKVTDISETYGRIMRKYSIYP